MTKAQKSFLEVLATEGAKRLSKRAVDQWLPQTVNPALKEKLRAEAEREIFNALEAVRWRFRKITELGKNVVMSRKDVLKACHVLQVPAPKIGSPVDLELANKNRRAQMKTYHPDVSPNTRDEYEAAVKAYDVLAAYNAALEGSTANG